MLGEHFVDQMLDLVALACPASHTLSIFGGGGCWIEKLLVEPRRPYSCIFDEIRRSDTTLFIAFWVLF